MISKARQGAKLGGSGQRKLGDKELEAVSASNSFERFLGIIAEKLDLEPKSSYTKDILYADSSDPVEQTLIM